MVYGKVLINGFNDSFKNIYTSYLDFGDESMSVIRLWNTDRGDLPHLSYIFYKLYTLGT